MFWEYIETNISLYPSFGISSNCYNFTNKNHNEITKK